MHEHEKKHGPKEAHEKTPRVEPHKHPDGNRDGEGASVAPINPPPADGGKVREGDKHPTGPIL